MDISDRIQIESRLDATLGQQLVQQLTWLIANGDLRPGDWLPAVRRLAAHLQISINTVRSAYQKLEADGLVETRHGAGTRVLAQDAASLSAIAAAARSHTVGIILPSFANPFYHPLLDGVEEVAREDGTMLFVCNTRDDPDQAWRYFAQLSAKHVDGIVVVSQDPSGFQMSHAQGQNAATPLLPIIAVDWPTATGCAVTMDLEDAGYQATRHLLEHGHRRVGLITFDREPANVAPVHAGYRRAVRERGGVEDPALIARVPAFDMAAGRVGAEHLLALAQPPTAIFTIADTLALGVLAALKAAGLRVPADIALASFNDISTAALLDPPLTSVVAPAYEMGVRAMRMLQAQIAGWPLNVMQVVLPVTLKVRASCGPHG